MLSITSCAVSQHTTLQDLHACMCLVLEKKCREKEMTVHGWGLVGKGRRVSTRATFDRLFIVVATNKKCLPQAKEWDREYMNNHTVQLLEKISMGSAMSRIFACVPPAAASALGRRMDFWHSVVNSILDKSYHPYIATGEQSYGAMISISIL